jgi:hypothetical protein
VKEEVAVVSDLEGARSTEERREMGDERERAEEDV